MEFLEVETLESARSKLLAASRALSGTETVNLGEAQGRILASDVYAGCDVPAFARSTVDGYAVLSQNTQAASESVPVILELAGKVEIGKPAGIHMQDGQCAEVPTGGMLPEGADGVVMVEDTEFIERIGVMVGAGVAWGENVVYAGEDAKAGELVAPKGKILRPQDIGALASVGITKVQVASKLYIGILSTGDELVAPGDEPKLGQIRDINTPALSALAQKGGLYVSGAEVVSDNETDLINAIERFKETCDIIAISGGSSKGPRDIVADVAQAACSGGILTHGIAIKPGKPALLAFDEVSSTVIAGLPGHPVSALMVFELVVLWLARELAGLAASHPIPAILDVNVAASPGMLTCVPVRLAWENGCYIAQPVFGKSGLVSVLSQADGYFAIDRGKEGLAKGSQVLVHLF
ncbi:MAG: molybdopterin molybdotransferase MoeA [Eubacteriaceae bacterium]|nr:molybdopterin molybdotransferase MoeA [Eubacteriaceae bacterium]